MTQEVPGPQRPPGTSDVRRRVPVDLYELLQISPRASREVIQAAYRVLARAYHPDVNASPEAAQLIRDLNDAYLVLSDPPRRARYDLECLRAVRFERLVQPDYARRGLHAPVAGSTRTQPVRPLRAPQQPVGDRLTMLSGTAILGLLVLATLAAILLVIFSMSIDAPADYSQVFDGRTIELARR